MGSDCANATPASRRASSRSAAPAPGSKRTISSRGAGSLAAAACAAGANAASRPVQATISRVLTHRSSNARRDWSSVSRTTVRGHAPRRLSVSRLLQDRQVPVQLPLGELRAVVVPFLTLDLDEAREHVFAERLEDQLRLGRDLDRLAERLRELLDSEPLPLVR